MSWWEAAILAAVQGLTEFLPVSSSGHLALLQGWMAPFRHDDLSFSILLHLATLTSVGLYYRADLIRIGAALLHRPGAAAPAGRPHPLASGGVPDLDDRTLREGILQQHGQLAATRSLRGL